MNEICECGQVCGDACDGTISTISPADSPVTILWVHPYMRGTAEAWGGPDDCGPEFWEVLSVRAECARIIFESPDPWVRARVME